MTFFDKNEWKLPLNFAVGLHIAVIAGAIYLPHFGNDPQFQDIYTVDLINLEAPSAPKDTAVQAAPSKPAPPLPEPKPEPEAVEENSAAILETPQKTAVAQEKPIRPVSIKPLKRKIVKKQNNQKAVAQQIRKQDELNRKALEEERRAEKLAEEAARLAALEAVDQLKELLRESETAAQTQKLPEKPGAASSSTTRNVVENRYFASIFSTLQPHWQLPEYKRWDRDLSATIVVHIARDGSIIDQYFEKKSGDRIFDQFVLKALQEGSPLPPIPAAMKKNNIELGLRFIPGSIE